MSIKVSTIIIIIKAISPSHATEPKSFMIMIMMIIIITLTLIYPPKCNNYYFLHPIANLDHCSEEANNTENKLKSQSVESSDRTKPFTVFLVTL